MGSAAGAGTNPPLPAHLKDNPAGADLAQFAPSRSEILRIQPLQLPSSSSSSPGLRVSQALVPCWSFDFSLPWSLGSSPAPCRALWDGKGDPGSGALSSPALTSLLSQKKQLLDSDLWISVRDPTGAELGSRRPGAPGPAP